MSEEVEKNVTVTASAPDYDDATTKKFVFATVLWGAVGMLVGILIALELAYWKPSGGATLPFLHKLLEIPYLSFGRLRPLHTNAVIFGFTANGIFAGVHYSTQRLTKRRMWSDALSNIHFWGWQAIIVSAALTLPLGLTQTHEYAELIWPIDIAIAVVWLTFGVNFMMTVLTRKTKHIYVALWFYISTVITITVLHVGNNLSLPASMTRSYSIYSGMTDALVQWWYGHNAVGFLLTTPLLGLMYYYLPKAAEKPVFSYRLSIIHFWALIFIYIWAGPHHLLWSALPDWAQTLGMAFSIALIAPSWGGMLNGLLTLRGAYDKVRRDPILKFLVVGLTFYGMSTFEGPMMSIRAVNSISHFTDWTVAHVHGGALGWVGGTIFATLYYLVPKLYNTKLHSVDLANQHFWLANIGMTLYIVAMWAAGVTQGLQWRSLNEDGTLTYGFLETVTSLIPLYWVRVGGGTLYLTGVLVMAWNLWKTVQDGKASAKAAA